MKTWTPSNGGTLVEQLLHHFLNLVPPRRSIQIEPPLAVFHLAPEVGPGVEPKPGRVVAPSRRSYSGSAADRLGGRVHRHRPRLSGPVAGNPGECGRGRARARRALKPRSDGAVPRNSASPTRRAAFTCPNRGSLVSSSVVFQPCRRRCRLSITGSQPAGRKGKSSHSWYIAVRPVAGCRAGSGDPCCQLSTGVRSPWP